MNDDEINVVLEKVRTVSRGEAFFIIGRERAKAYDVQDVACVEVQADGSIGIRSNVGDLDRTIEMFAAALERAKQLREAQYQTPEDVAVFLF